MGKLIISDNVSLDGVIQDPAGDEGFRVGGWVGVIAGRPELAKATLDEAQSTEALLLGRRSYEWLAARWPPWTGALVGRSQTHTGQSPTLRPRGASISPPSDTTSHRSPRPGNARPAHQARKC